MSVGNPQRFNRYSYVGNDPLNMRDPSGLMRMQPQGDPEADPASDPPEDPPGDPFETGRSITAEEDSRYDHRVSDAIEANKEVGETSGSDHAPPGEEEVEHDRNAGNDSAVDPQKSDIDEIHAGNGIWVIIWTGTSYWNPIFKFGHVSYVIGGQSYSWEDYTDPKTGKETWRIDPANDYIKEKEAAGATGVAYLLDFGSARSNKRFRNDLIRAGSGHYDLFVNNCTYPFSRAINSERLKGVPKNENIKPSSQGQFIKDYLVPRGIVITELRF